MSLLLDTHVILWFLANDPKLSSTACARVAWSTDEVAEHGRPKLRPWHPGDSDGDDATRRRGVALSGLWQT
jgi:hypothetical protein